MDRLDAEVVLGQQSLDGAGVEAEDVERRPGGLQVIDRGAALHPVPRVSDDGEEVGLPRDIDIDDRSRFRELSQGRHDGVGIVDVLQNAAEGRRVESGIARGRELLDRAPLEVDSEAIPRAGSHGLARLEPDGIDSFETGRREELSTAAPHVEDGESAPSELLLELPDQHAIALDLPLGVGVAEVLLRLAVKPLRVEGKGKRIREEKSASVAPDDAGLDALAVAVMISAAEPENSLRVDV